MDDFFISGASLKIKVARSQSHSETVATMAGVFRAMMDRMFEDMKVLAGTPKGEDIPEPMAMEPDLAKQVMLKMLEHIVATGNGLNGAERESNRAHFSGLEHFHPELAGKHYALEVLYGDQPEDEVVMRIHSISDLPTEIH
jgi:hypothetical protein